MYSTISTIASHLPKNSPGFDFTGRKCFTTQRPNRIVFDWSVWQDPTECSASVLIYRRRCSRNSTCQSGFISDYRVQMQQIRDALWSRTDRQNSSEQDEWRCVQSDKTWVQCPVSVLFTDLKAVIRKSDHTARARKSLRSTHRLWCIKCFWNLISFMNLYEWGRCAWILSWEKVQKLFLPQL